MTANERKELLTKAKPILFNTEMVRAILDGRKTVTRRLVKPQPPANTDDVYFNYIKNGMARWGWENSSALCDRKLPYQSGDILYVRETWCKGSLNYGIEQYYYKVDDKIAHCRWKPSIHMPKEATRIFLKVTNVRVERLQEITAEQCVAEGLGREPLDEVGVDFMRGIFEDLWNSTVKKKDLGKYGWEANPWVWVIEFERAEVTE